MSEAPLCNTIIPLYFTEPLKKDLFVTTRYYKIYYDSFDKQIKCTIIGNKLTEEEIKMILQFGELKHTDAIIKSLFVAIIQITLVFDKQKFINFIIHYANSPGLIFSIFNEYDAIDQLTTISKLFTALENDIIYTTLKNSNRITQSTYARLNTTCTKIELVKLDNKENSKNL